MEYQNQNEEGNNSLATAESEQDAGRRLKKQLRNRTYYLKNREQLQEKARDAYYRHREEGAEVRTQEGGILISLTLIIAITAAIVFAILKRSQEERQESVPPPPQTYNEIDIGGGRTIKIPIDKVTSNSSG